MSAVAELLERVRAATGPDRAIDRDIAEHIVGAKFRSTKRGREWLVDSHGGEETWSRHAEPVTASIDAALALTERALPGWKWNVGMDASDELHATVWRGVDEFDEYGASVALAILAATLQALASQEPQP